MAPEPGLEGDEMGDIGEPQRYYEVLPIPDEPFPFSAPAPVPAPERAPVEQPAR